jgi:hypothetical protein
MAETNTKKELLTKILFIIGIIFLVFIFAFALVKLVPKVFSGIASVGQFITSSFISKEIKITANDTSLNSGDKFILKWKYEPNKDGDYNISYECEENLVIQISSNKGPQTLLCGTQYNLKDIESAELTATLKKLNAFADLPIKIEYVDSDTKSILASGEIKLSVKNETENASNAVIIAEPIIDNSTTDTSADSDSTKNTFVQNVFIGNVTFLIFESSKLKLKTTH